MKKYISLLLIVFFSFVSVANVEAYVHRRKHSKPIGVSWDESASSPTLTRIGTGSSATAAAKLPENLMAGLQVDMKRCVINDAGVVQYYLCPTDSTLQSDCSTGANLDGTDGQVMVEIPLFWYKYSYSGTTHTWLISPEQFAGAERHPAFYKNGAWVDYRYIGAYEGVLYDTSETTYINGLYLPSNATYTISFLDNGGADDTITSDVATHAFTNLLAANDKIVVSGSTVNDGTYTIKSVTDTVITLETGTLAGTQANDQCILYVQTDYTAVTGDVLASVSGKAPAVQGTRDDFRDVAATRGTGWRQQDYDLISAIQLLYLTEYASWYSQSMIGAGLTDWSSATWAAWNNYNPIETTGNSNSDGNATANTSGGSGTTGSYMSYRGIENFFGHLWKWADGINVNGNIPYACNTDTQFADDTVTNYTRLEDTGGAGITLINASGWQVTLEQTARGFLPASVGGSSSTYITDYYYQAAAWRVAKLGGSARGGAYAGVAYWNLYDSSGDLSRDVGSRLSY